MSFSEKHCDHCLSKTSKNGKTTWFHNVLEAKLVCSNGKCRVKTHLIAKLV
jgi:hypothetical protein